MTIRPHEDYIIVQLNDLELESITKLSGTYNEFCEHGFTQSVSDMISHFIFDVITQCNDDQHDCSDLIQSLLDGGFSCGITRDEKTGITEVNISALNRTVSNNECIYSDNPPWGLCIECFLRNMVNNIIHSTIAEHGWSVEDLKREDVYTEICNIVFSSSCFVSALSGIVASFVESSNIESLDGNTLGEAVQNLPDGLAMPLIQVLDRFTTACDLAVVTCLGAIVNGETDLWSVDENEENTDKSKYFCYKVKNLDTALDVSKFIEKGCIVKKRLNYYVCSSVNYALLTEYGKRMNGFFYEDEDILCRIKNGNVA